MTTPTLVRFAGVALPIHRRTLVYVALSAVALVALSVLTLCLGRLGVPLTSLPAALTGNLDGAVAFALERIRGPRLATAVLVGALLGISGGLFQAVTRNPLGSPDVIGIGAGAGAGVAVCTLLFVGVPTTAGAVLGAAAAAALVYVSTGRGFRAPARIIIAGIGVAAMAHAVTQYVVSTQLRDAAAALAGYLAGSLNAATFGDAAVAGVTLAVVLPLAWALGPSLQLIELGDDVARGLSGHPDRTRTVAIVVSVIAAAAAVAAAGPISFVALTAPQIAARMCRTSLASASATAITGALLLVAADLVATHVPVVAGLPVGIVTLGVGGLYLGWLLVRQWKRGRL